MAGRRVLERGRIVAERLLAPPGALLETARAVRVRLQIIAVRQRASVHRRFPAPLAAGEAPRVLAVVTHVGDPASPGDGAARLGATLEGLLESLGQTRLELVVNALPGRHVVASLPAHLRERVTVRERDGVEPLFLGFEAQEEFAARVEEFDWFLFLEDDLVLHDALLLEKLTFFNEAAPLEAVLLPHRYELAEGRKIRIDLRGKRRTSESHTVNRLTVIEHGDWRFAEFENPHSGFYCLSQAQLRRWLATGRQWKGTSSYYGPLESAATGSLEEAFRIYKPHPDTIGFLEIRHLGTKYSDLYASFDPLDAEEG
jgi:hypothetical protein